MGDFYLIMFYMEGHMYFSSVYSYISGFIIKIHCALQDLTQHQVSI